MPQSHHLYLVSACLLGLCTRYDGKTTKNEECIKRLTNAVWIPICPEQLGGLPTPREATDIIDGNGDDVLMGRSEVVTRGGRTISREFIKGAEQVLAIATSQNVTAVFLKSRSPSCAVTGTIGVTAALLRKNGFHLEEF